MQGSQKWEKNCYEWFWEFAELLESIGREKEARYIKGLSAGIQKSGADIVIAGSANAGKSTLVNAMVGQKIQYTGLAPHTGRTVRLHYKEGVDLVDGPGTLAEGGMGEKGFLFPHAEVIVYMFFATRVFDAGDFQAVRQLYQRWKRKTVFFVVNGQDLIPEGMFNSVTARLKECLRRTFKEDMGTVEHLLGQRLYFTNAYLAECIRTHSLWKGKQGRKEILLEALPEDIEGTGVPELERGLVECLKQPFAGMQRYRNYLSILRQIAARAEQAIEKRSVSVHKCQESLLEKEQGLEDAMARLIRIGRQIDMLCSQMLMETAMTVGAAYDEFVREVENHWNAYFSAVEIKFGIEEQAKLAELQIKYGMKQIAAEGNRLSKKDMERKTAEFQKVTQSVSEKIQEYVRIRAGEMKDKIEWECRKIFLLYERKLSKASGMAYRIDMEEVDLSSRGNIDYQELKKLYRDNMKRWSGRTCCEGVWLLEVEDQKAKEEVLKALSAIELSQAQAKDYGNMEKV